MRMNDHRIRTEWICVFLCDQRYLHIFLEIQEMYQKNLLHICDYCIFVIEADQEDSVSSRGTGALGSEKNTSKIHQKLHFFRSENISKIVEYI